MFNQNKQNIKQLDFTIAGIIWEITNEEHSEEDIISMRENLKFLIGYRTDLCATKVESKMGETILKGIFGIASIALIMYYEKTEIITTKGFNIATRLIGA